MDGGWWTVLKTIPAVQAKAWTVDNVAQYRPRIAAWIDELFALCHAQSFLPRAPGKFSAMPAP